MFLRDDHGEVSFTELENRASEFIDTYRANLTRAKLTTGMQIVDGVPITERGPIAVGSRTTNDIPVVISASVNLETATSILTLFLAHIPFLPLNPLLNPSLNPQASPSILSSILNPQSSILLRTSGSTGKPKWVSYTRAQIHAAAASSESAMRPPPGAPWLLNLPLHHAGGLGILLRSLLWRTPVHISDRRDAASILETLEAFPDISTISLVPTQLHDILALAGPQPLRRLNNILVGAGSLSEADLETVNKHRLPVRQSYGMTETLGHFCVTNRASEAPIGFRACGNPLPGNELTVVGDDGHPLPEGHVGHIRIRGPQVISDYAESDPSKFDGGWFHTGDYGYLENGELFFVARRTDMVKTGGENVIAARVESAVKDLPYIIDCAIIALDDPRWGQRVHACISLHPNTSVNLDSLRNDLRNKLLPFELPRSLSIHAHIPRNSMGKLQREDLVVENPEIL